MSNPYISYYNQQSGSGIQGFAGTRFQRGGGFWSKLFSNTIIPALKYVGKAAVSTGSNVLEDVIEGRNVKEAIKEHGITSLKKMGRKAVKTARESVQDDQFGSGKRKKRKTKKSVLKIEPKPKPKKKTKTTKGPKLVYRSKVNKSNRNIPDFLK